MLEGPGKWYLDGGLHNSLCANEAIVLPLPRVQSFFLPTLSISVMEMELTCCTLRSAAPAQSFHKAIIAPRKHLLMQGAVHVPVMFIRLCATVSQQVCFSY